MAPIPNTTRSGTAFAMLPRHPGNPAPTLVLLATTGADTLSTEPYCRTGCLLHARGWNVVSLDLPCHGADVRPDEPVELAGWAARLAQGENIVASFQQRVNDVIEHLVATGVADPERLAAAGTSRGGFMAFQAAAGNPGLRAVAAFAPATDLIALREFAGQETNPLMRALALTATTETLADRAAWIIIGNADDRVDTDKTVVFARSLARAATTRGLQPRITLHIVPTPGHASCTEWHEEAAVWLHNQFITKE